MRIVSVIRRKRGTDVVFDGIEYRFRPEDPEDPTSPHVAEVEREDHVQRFLAIPEGYKLHSDAFMPAKSASRAGELAARVETLQAAVAEREAAVAELDAKVLDLTNALAERDATIELLNASVADLTKQLDQATAPASEADKPIEKTKRSK